MDFLDCGVLHYLRQRWDFLNDFTIDVSAKFLELLVSPTYRRLVVPLQSLSLGLDFPLLVSEFTFFHLEEASLVRRLDIVVERHDGHSFLDTHLGVFWSQSKTSLDLREWSEWERVAIEDLNDWFQHWVRPKLVVLSVHDSLVEGISLINHLLFSVEHFQLVDGRLKVYDSPENHGNVS